MSELFHNTVACIVERDGHFLTVEETVDGKRVFNQPAGHLEAGESLIEAAVRETLEETGWHVEPTALVGIYQYRPAGSDLQFIRHCFAARPLKHEAWRELDAEIIRAVWMDPDELRRFRRRLRSPMVLGCIEDYQAGNHAPLSLFRTVPS